MFNRHTVAVALLAAVIAGCSDDSAKPYGHAMQPMPDTSSMPPVVTVPAGAQSLSSGTYNQIQFTVPSQSGSLYVFDEESNKVVGQTNSVDTNAGKPMTMADLKNTAQGLNMTDHYRIYFAPTHTTTQPIGG